MRVQKKRDLYSIIKNFYWTFRYMKYWTFSNIRWIIVKSLIFKHPKKKLYYLCLLSGDKLVSLNKLSLNINDEVEKALAKEVKDQTGYSIGGVPPVAHVKSPAQIFIDLNLKRFEKIYAAAGHPYVVFGITFEQICQITNGNIIDFVE